MVRSVVAVSILAGSVILAAVPNVHTNGLAKEVITGESVHNQGLHQDARNTGSEVIQTRISKNPVHLDIRDNAAYFSLVMPCTLGLSLYPLILFLFLFGVAILKHTLENGHPNGLLDSNHMTAI